MKAAFALLTILMCGTVHSQAFKCVGPDGKVSFQGQPCASDEKSQQIKIDRPAPLTADQQRILNATASGKITRGMTADQVRSSWGSPTKINRTVGSYGTNEQWVYDSSNFRAQYIYLENGVVTSFQTPGN